jgi:exodeoxyribonuclease V alpha subunit
VQLLEIPENIIAQAINEELLEGNLVSESIDGQQALFLTPLYRAETGCASNLLRLRQGSLPWGEIDTAKAISWVEEKAGPQPPTLYLSFAGRCWAFMHVRTISVQKLITLKW